MSDTIIDDIYEVVTASKLTGFTGTYRELGGGELNDTFVLDCSDRKVVLRIAKYSGSANLHREARALGLLNLKQVPRLLYFDESSHIRGRSWILESFLEGEAGNTLSVKQFYNLGAVLAQVHSIRQSEPRRVHFWNDFLEACKSFGDEQALLSHPDPELKKLIQKSRTYLASQSGTVCPALTHGDVTPGNMLFKDADVLLIDWELSGFKDPMADFSTLYYEDMEYNRGSWRLHIKKEEQVALFEGYVQAGGVADEKRLQVWMNIDKLGAAIYLYWKMHQSGHPIEDSRLLQYQLDYKNLQESLERNLPTSS